MSDQFMKVEIMVFKFAHVADIHIGANSNPKLREIELSVFEEAINTCIAQKVNFILFAGDIFDSNIPDLNSVDRAVQIMKKCMNANIPLYVIYGGHDSSVGQKSIIDILNSAGLFIKITKGKISTNDKLELTFTEDPTTGAKLVGLSGRSVSLDIHDYDILNRKKLEEEEGFKIFVFHNAIDELKPGTLSKMQSFPINMLPKGFDYYAGGHIHKKIHEKKGSFENYGDIVYPGPLFAAGAKDMEDASKGAKRGFFIVEFDEIIKKVEFIEIKTIDYINYEYNANNKTASQVKDELRKKLGQLDVQNKIVVLKVTGTLSTGKTSDINFSELRKILYQNEAYYVNLNRYGLRSKNLTISMSGGIQREEVEHSLFKENIDSVDVKQKNLIGEKGVLTAIKLLNTMRKPKKLNEKKNNYEERILDESQEILDIREVLK
ncbi:MAG: DNA repair exonuclease [archaeon]|nr:DNA repair exonuclease [archaeon]